MKQFVAMTDDVLYRLDGPPGPLIPYQCGIFCWHQLREEGSTSQSVDPLRTPGGSDRENGAVLSA